jgi:hypothetical protein
MIQYANKYFFVGKSKNYNFDMRFMYLNQFFAKLAAANVPYDF